MMRAPRPDAGFTLVEALVSLFVFGLISAGAVAMLSQSVAAQKQAAAAHENLRQLQTLRATLGADVAQFARRGLRRPDGAPGPAFAGGAQVVNPEASKATILLQMARTAAPLEPGPAGFNRVAEITYLVDGDRLVRRTRTNLSRQPDPAALEQRVMLSGVSDMKIAFYDGMVWRPDWAALGGVTPRAVAIEFVSPRYGLVRVETLVGLGE
jgi:type II secretion system protein J